MKLDIKEGTYKIIQVDDRLWVVRAGFMINFEKVISGNIPHYMLVQDLNNMSDMITNQGLVVKSRFHIYKDLTKGFYERVLPRVFNFRILNRKFTLKAFFSLQSRCEY